MKKVLKSKPIKMLGILIVFTIIYILSFHINIRDYIPVYTYYGIFSLVILTIILSIMLVVFSNKKKISFDIKDCIIIILICFFINLFVFCMVPVTLERSISVFMLNYMSDGNQYTKEEIENTFIDKYVYEYGAFDKRFEEQIYTGTISEEEDKYKINNKGKTMVKLFHFIKGIYNVNGKILN